MAIQLYDLAAAEDDRRYSPYCWRVKMALKHKGLDFETVPWRMIEKDVIAPYKATTVPVLVDGSNSVYDSWAIALYLDEVYPSRPRLFGGTEARTLADFFNQWTVKSVHPAILRVIILDIFGKLPEKDKAYFRQSREKRFGMTLEQLGADPKGAVAAFRGALDPVRPVLWPWPALWVFIEFQSRSLSRMGLSKNRGRARQLKKAQSWNLLSGLIV